VHTSVLLNLNGLLRFMKYFCSHRLNLGKSWVKGISWRFHQIRCPTNATNWTINLKLIQGRLSIRHNNHFFRNLRKRSFTTTSKYRGTIIIIILTYFTQSSSKHMEINRQNNVPDATWDDNPQLICLGLFKLQLISSQALAKIMTKEGLSSNIIVALFIPSKLTFP
jgi:hypothetical protein